MVSRRKAVLRVSQVCLLLLAAWGLFHWWRVRPAAIVSDDAIDDLIEEVGDTYVPVHIGDIERGTLRRYVTAYGTVQPAPAMDGHDAGGAQITSPVIATVTNVACVEGGHVENGEPLFELDARSVDASIDQAMHLVSADQIAIEKSSKDTTTPAWKLADAQRQLVVDQNALDQWRGQRNRLTIVAPMAGTVTNLNIVAGNIVDPNKTAVEIVDLDRLVVTLDVPTANLGELSIGQHAMIELRSNHSTTQPTQLGGTVALVDAAIDPATGMGSADIAISAGCGLRPGQFVRAQITVGEESDRLMVPMISVTQNQNGDPAVGKIEGDLKSDGRWAVLVPVKTGWKDGDKIEIDGEGLAAGQAVVTVGANGLVQRTRLHLLRD